jgi:hypothetical protein
MALGIWDTNSFDIKSSTDALIDGNPDATLI